jgi:hypothetical protein
MSNYNAIAIATGEHFQRREDKAVMIFITFCSLELSVGGVL